MNGNGKLDEEEKFYGTLDELMEAIAKGKYPAPPARGRISACPRKNFSLGRQK
nr:hypothetical protein [uncultured Prevotella sp.]